MLCLADAGDDRCWGLGKKEGRWTRKKRSSETGEEVLVVLLAENVFDRGVREARL